MSDQNKNINHYSAADIQKYLNGELSAQEMHGMEKAALDDPFLSDAMEGMKDHLQKNSIADFNNDVTELEKRLAGKRQKEKKAIIISPRLMWQRIAAIAVILIGSTFVIYNFVIKDSSAKNKSIALTKEKTVTDSIIIPNTSASTAKKDSVVINADVAINEKSKAVKSFKKETAQQDLEKGLFNDSAEAIKDIKAGAEKSDADKTPLPSVAKNEEKQKDKTAAVTQLDTLKLVAGNASPKIVESTLQGKVAGISVSKRKNKADGFSNNSIQGRVTDENKNPIPAATVMIKGKKIVTNTDQNGNFKLNNISNNDSVNVVVNSVGFHSASVALSNNNASGNEIRLKQITQSLNEVVVVGYGSSKKKEIVDTTYNDDDDSTADINDEEDMTFNALPIIGWHDFNNYINKNKKISTSDSTIKGREIISFIVDKNDKVSSFKIKKSLSKSHDAEAIRLIQQGPMWRLLRGKKEKITLAIVF